MNRSKSDLEGPRFRLALDRLCDGGGRIRDSFHFDWPGSLDQTVHRLRMDFDHEGRGPCLVALVGGASSGKSTIFNNLLGGRSASRITAWGHATMGLVLAVHEEQRPLVERLISAQALFPGLKHRFAQLDDNVTGEPDALTIVFHTCDSLRGILLLDTPDFTSQMAKVEGEVLLTCLPWFDRLIVVLDQERWYDRQSVSMLRAESLRWGQDRFVLFNRTADGIPAESHQEVIRQQADRLSSAGLSVLEFRRGRGLRAFPPQAFAELLAFLRSPYPARESALVLQLGVSANRVLNLNEERHQRLIELKSALKEAANRCVPTVNECMTGLMTPEECKLLEPVSRILGIRNTGHWLSRLAQEWRDSLRGILGISGQDAETAGSGELAGRQAVAANYFQTLAARAAYEIQRTVRGSLFWAEIGNWCGLQPATAGFGGTDERGRLNPSEIIDRRRGDITALADGFERAFRKWSDRVEQECRGLTPNVKGAVGLSVIALAVVLIVAPGPVTALTLVAAKGAVGGALAQLAAAGGFGALFGKQLGRLTSVIRERLLGSPELRAMTEAAERFRSLCGTAVRELVERAEGEASALVLPASDPLFAALSDLRRYGEIPPLVRTAHPMTSMMKDRP